MLAPLTLENFEKAWEAAPFARYFLNTFVLVSLILAGQFFLCTLAAFAFARFRFPGRNLLFALVLLQLLVMPDILMVENYQTMRLLNLVDTIPAIALPYIASGFGIFLLRQTFMTIPRGSSTRQPGSKALLSSGVLWKVYIPLAKPTYLAYGLVSVSHHWNNFLWPLIVTNSVETRPVTVGLSIFSAIDSGVEWSVINAATLMTSGPAADCLPAVPAPVRAELHACGDQIAGNFSENARSLGSRGIRAPVRSGLQSALAAGIAAVVVFL